TFAPKRGCIASGRNDGNNRAEIGRLAHGLQISRTEARVELPTVVRQGPRHSGGDIVFANDRRQRTDVGGGGRRLRSPGGSGSRSHSLLREQPGFASTGMGGGRGRYREEISTDRSCSAKRPPDGLTVSTASLETEIRNDDLPRRQHDRQGVNRLATEKWA